MKGAENQKGLESYIKWWKGEQGNENNICEKLEQTAKLFNLEWVNIKKGWEGWGIESRLDKTEELKELSQPKSEEVIASIQQDEEIRILTRWVPKTNSEGRRKPASDQAQERRAYEISRGMVSRRNRRQRTDKKTRQSNQRSSTQNQYNKRIICGMQMRSSGKNRRDSKLCHEVYKHHR